MRGEGDGRLREIPRQKDEIRGKKEEDEDRKKAKFPPIELLCMYEGFLFFILHFMILPDTVGVEEGLEG